jgi:hypothetical protein
MNWLKRKLHFLHVHKDAKPQVRRVLLPSVADDLIKAIIECAINSFNGNYKLTKDENSKLSSYKNRLRALIDQKISF